MNTPSAHLLDLLRHGEPVGGGRFRGGATDDPLSEQGWQQMWQAVDTHIPWHAIISSPLQRCSAFATALAQRHQLPLTLEPALRELHFGDWEGRNAEALQQSDPTALARFWSDPLTHTPPGAERLDVFQTRILQGLHRQLDRHADGHLLVIGHGGTLRMILCAVLQMPLAASIRLELPYAALSRVRMYRDAHGQWQGSLVFHGGKP